MGAKANLSPLARTMAIIKTNGWIPSSGLLEKTNHESQYDNMASTTDPIQLPSPSSKYIIQYVFWRW